MYRMSAAPKKKVIINKSHYPMDYITYLNKEGNLPKDLPDSMERTKQLGYSILKLTPDSFNDIKPYHAGFKHIKEITVPKLKELKKSNPKIKGFFIIEGDVLIDETFNFKKFIKENYKEPIWLGWKKKLSNFIVGNFLIYIPINYLNEFNSLLEKQKRLVYSDRFFSKLYFNDFLKLKEKSVATEIVHYSNVKKGIRL